MRKLYISLIRSCMDFAAPAWQPWLRLHLAALIKTSRTRPSSTREQLPSMSKPISLKTTPWRGFAKTPYCWFKFAVATAASSKLIAIFLIRQLIPHVQGVERNRIESSIGLQNAQGPRQLD